MSDSSRWPKGVPPLPDWFRCYLLRDSTMRWIAYAPVRTEYKARRDAEQAVLPSIVLRHDGVVVCANAAARALGIVPDDEQEPSND